MLGRIPVVPYDVEPSSHSDIVDSCILDALVAGCPKRVQIKRSEVFSDDRYPQCGIWAGSWREAVFMLAF
eukprot:3339651-Karenia_brevis.AAC.1